MALERLQSIFNNIEDNKQSLEDGYPVESISNSVDDNIHSFGTQGNRTELISITKINKRQDPSPLMAINGIFVEDAKGNLSQIEINPVNGHNFKEIRINDNAGTNLLQTVVGEHGGFGEVVSSIPDVSPINLGTSKQFRFSSLFAHNHGKPPNRPVNNSLPGSLRSDLQLYIEPKNTQNLNIKSHSPNFGASRNGAFGFIKEPYITHNIPESGAAGGIKAGYNRDGFPVRARLEDVTRLGAFYSSNKGLLSLAAENITNVAIGDGFTLAEPFGGLLLPAFPIPMTGFLNSYQQSKQGKFQGIEFPGKVKEVLKKGIRGYGFELKDIPGGNTVSIRKPGVKEYSDMFNSTLTRPFVAANQGDTDPFLNTTFTNPIKLEEYRDNEARRIDKRFKTDHNQNDAVAGAAGVPSVPGNVETAGDKAKNIGGHIGNGVIATLNGASSAVNFLHNQVRKAVHAAKKAAADEFEKIANQGVALPHNPTADFLGLGTGPYSALDRPSLVPPSDPGDAEEDFFDPGDFYVRIHDARGIEKNPNGRFLYFRGFVTGITENVTPTWNPTTYIGRSEDVWIYQKGERDVSFNLRVAPANSREHEYMYQKMEVLTSMAYPAYSDSNRMQPPFAYLYMAHIGSKAVGQFGYFKSITYTVNETGDWDALTQLPRVFDIALSFQILNKKPPQAAPFTKYYNLNASDVQQ